MLQGMNECFLAMRNASRSSTKPLPAPSASVCSTGGLREAGLVTQWSAGFHSSRTSSALGVLSWTGVEVTNFKVRRCTFLEYSLQLLAVVSTS